MNSVKHLVPPAVFMRAPSNDEALRHFIARCEATQPVDVLEIGTKRSSLEPTHHRSWFGKCRFVMSDFEAGTDVDVVADVHNLVWPFGLGAFDAVVACSVFEHLERPWVAAKQILHVLRPGGKFYIQTHHTFKLHGYPRDYYRFSREALESLFTAAGASDLVSSYEFDAEIYPHNPFVARGNDYGPMNVAITGRK